MAAEGKHPPIPDHLSLSCRRFLARCFEASPAARASASDLLTDPWLATTPSPMSRAPSGNEGAVVPPLSRTQSGAADAGPSAAAPAPPPPSFSRSLSVAGDVARS